MPAAYSLTCPTCGNPFLATLGEATTITTCPHCAFNGPVQAFAAAGIDRLSQNPSIPLRRRDIRHRARLDPTPPLQPAPPPAAPPLPELPAHPHQDHQAHHFSPTAHPVSGPLSRHVPVPSSLPPLAPAYPQSASPQLLPAQHSDSLPAAPSTRPQNLPIGKILLFLFASLFIAAGAGYLYWERQQELLRNRTADYAQAPTPRPPTPTPALEIRPAQPATTSPSDTPPPDLPPPDPALQLSILAAEVPDFIQTLFAAPDNARHRFLTGHTKDDPSLPTFFARTPTVTPIATKLLPVAPIDLVSGQPVALFQTTTSANPIGALARITRNSDGSLSLHWPFFQETHDTALNQYVGDTTANAPQWFHVGIRRSHGLDLPPELRDTHFILNIQASAGGLLSTHAIAAKELPAGRFIDQKCAWQAVYLCHLLLQKKPLADGTLALEILDCAGASLTR